MPLNYTPLVILAAVFVLIAIRQVAGFRLAIWQIMSAGALFAIATGSISPSDALRSIDLDVMVFLSGMFIVGEALVESGYLYHVSYGLFRSATSIDRLVLLILLVFGFFSAFLMNDTVAIIGTPLVLFFAERHGVSQKLMLLSLCFAVTIGSAASPIGNPQNLLIAINGGIGEPFQTFFYHLAIPTAVNLLLAFFVLKFFFRVHFHTGALDNLQDEVKDRHLARLAKWAVVLIFLMVGAKVAGVFFGYDFPMTYVAVAAALPVIVFSPRRIVVLKKIDWHTLVFFAAMFVLMEAVWEAGAIQAAVNGYGGDIASVEVIMAASLILSQVLSNVPFVALYLPVLAHAGADASGMMALAAGSTIAGNLLILGAASNIIVIQNAEKRRATLTFYDFARVGVPLTILNCLVYWAYLSWIS